MRKILSFVVCVLMVSAQLTSHVYAAPSNWAVEEVAEAIDEGLVPSVLNENHQDKIKRYEYVLLALEVLEAAGVDVDVIRRYPFTDTYDHPYGEEIAIAFNAGIVKGNGEGQFKPDDYITRQEVASLVYNLVVAIEMEEPNADHHTYEDQSQIAGWAMDYINYCYGQGIIKGVGVGSTGGAIISPLGPTTKEQAMVLLYRLSLKKEFVGTIEVEDNDFVGFANNSNAEVARYIMPLVKDRTLTLRNIEDRQIEVLYNGVSIMTIIEDGSNVSIQIKSGVPITGELMTMLFDLSEIYWSSEEIKVVIERSVNGFEMSRDFVIEQASDDGTYVWCGFNEETNQYDYNIVINRVIRGGY